MSTNQTLFPTNDQRGYTWRFDEEQFSTNMLDKTRSESDVVATLQDMLSSRLEHKRPKAVTGCMIVVYRDQLQQLLHNGNTICINGFVQCNVPITQAALKRWLKDCEWSRLRGGLYDDTDFRRIIDDPEFIKIKVYRELKLQNTNSQKSCQGTDHPLSPLLTLHQNPNHNSKFHI